MSRLTAYRLGPALPRMEPGRVRRDWMDASPGGFAYRCLPLTIANGHGWEIIGAAGFEAVWNGGDGPADIAIRARPGDGSQGVPLPVSHFGCGVLTFHVDALIRTAPGLSLWVGGPPNAPRDGIAPLTGIVETDWSPMTFTMNWRFTRAHHLVRFAAGEPIGFFFPLQRDLVPETDPVISAPEPDVAAPHEAWRQSRGSFNAALREPGSTARAQGWQRDYHRGAQATKAGARAFQEAGDAEPPG